MTEQEAKKMLQEKLTCMTLEDLSCIEKGCDRDCDNCDHNYGQGTSGEQKEALSMAIKALEEVQQYRAIGTVQECRAAVEKQNAKKPKEYEDKFYGCPICGNVLLHKWAKYPTQLTPKTNALPYCLRCGQKLDWSKEE